MFFKQQDCHNYVEGKLLDLKSQYTQCMKFSMMIRRKYFTNRYRERLNLISRKNMLHNFKFISPVIATYILNCYICPARLFIIGEGELLCKEGTTQSDPTSIGVYALRMLPVLQFLLDFISVDKLNAKKVAFADDFTAAGKFSIIKTVGVNQNLLVQSMVTFQKHQNLTLQ